MKPAQAMASSLELFLAVFVDLDDSFAPPVALAEPSFGVVRNVASLEKRPSMIALVSKRVVPHLSPK
jgi:hypothetical protein